MHNQERSLFLDLVIFEEKNIYWHLLDNKLINLKDEIEINAGKEKNTFNIIYEAVKNNDLKLLQSLLESNVDWSNTELLLDFFAESPLLCAVKEKNEEAIKILLESKIDWNMVELNKPKIRNQKYDAYKATIAKLLKK